MSITSDRKRAARLGLTLTELIVVLAITGLLLTLSISGVLQARATSRRGQCSSHLAQQARAALIHENLHQRLPTCGWGSIWIGMADRGYRLEQPGGWIFNVLPFCDEATIRELAPRSRVQLDDAAIRTFANSVVPLFLCPERGGNPVIRVSSAFVIPGATQFDTAARTDYAANSGNKTCDTQHGPPSLMEGDSNSYSWPDARHCSGICYFRSSIALTQIKDGSSKVLLIGEKWATAIGAHDEGMNQPLYSGDCWDIRRLTLDPPMLDARSGSFYGFGSAHADGIGVAYCDGSVHSIDYLVDGELFLQLGGRSDASQMVGPKTGQEVL